jgi:hypothetical protein
MRKGGLKMPAAAKEDVMTDFQFRSIVKMILAIMERSTSLEDAVTTVKALLESKSQ